MSSEQYSNMAMAGKPHNEQSNSQNTPTFSVSKILYCSPHGNMSKKPARFYDLTSAFPDADTLSANDFITAGELAYKELPKNDDTKEL